MLDRAHPPESPYLSSNQLVPGVLSAVTSRHVVSCHTTAADAVCSRAEVPRSSASAGAGADATGTSVKFYKLSICEG